jgi:dCTP deaminase
MEGGDKLMILSGAEIVNQNKKGNIHIDNFNDKQVNPNSYNLTLNKKLLTYKNEVLDMKKKNETEELIIPEEGLLIKPGKLYLGRTNERTYTKGFVPMLEGRSSIGRLGIFIHITAGFGDQGFNGFWTLEISCIQPVRIYADVEIGQIFYHSIKGDLIDYRSNKYQNNKDVQASMLYKDFAS